MRRHYPDLTEVKKELQLIAWEIIFCTIRSIPRIQKHLNGISDYEARGVHIEKLQKVVAKREKLRRKYRYLHIAYSELRGIPREKIERPVRAEEINEIELQKVKDACLQKISKW